MFDDILKFPVWASNIACWMTFPSNYPLSSGSFPKSHVCLPEGKHENNSRHMQATCKHHLCWHHVASHEKTHICPHMFLNQKYDDNGIPGACNKSVGSS